MPPALRNGWTIGRAAFSWIDDHNEPGAVGAGRMPMNVRGGRRVTTADAYLPPGETPSNLTIRADSPVDCVIFAGTTAVGVRLADGTVVEGGRIVLCAGVYGSPAILLRSGIGRHGDRVDLPGVGENLVDEYIVSCGELGIAVTVYEPIAAGILSNKTMEDILTLWSPWVESGFYKRLLAPGKVERSFAVTDGLRPIADRVQATITQLALAWVLHQPGVAAALAGSSNESHMRENAQAAELRLPDGILAEIEQLIPLGPAFA